MNLRPVTMADHQFVLECYKEWPVTDRGPVTEDKVTNWIRRWVHRSDEDCLIGEVGPPVGLITYRLGPACCVVDNLIIHPSFRRRKLSNQIITGLRDKLVKEGIVVAEFDAMDGPIANHVKNGKYQFISKKQGQTGELVRGRLTYDMRL